MKSQLGANLGPFAPLAENLQGITEALAATSTQREVIEIVLTPAVKALGAVAGIVLLVDETDQQMKIAGSQGYEDGALTLWQEGPIADHVLISDILRMKEALYFEYAGALKKAYPDLESRTVTLEVVANAVLPMFLDNQPLGVIVLDFTEPHTFTPAERRFLTILSGQCAVALGRAEVTATLEERVEERTRQLETERTALAAFMAFTEAVGTCTDLASLVVQAIEVLRVRFPDASIVYYEQEDKLWKARVWSDDVSPALAALISAGVPLETSMFAQMVHTRQPVFTDDWGTQREGVKLSREYGAVVTYPLTVNGELHWLLAIGLRHTRTWSEADRELVRAVGRGLNLALERAQAAQELTLQNAELQARTRALEAFADLTRDLALTIDPLLLIRCAQEVMMSMLADGASLYMVPEGELWYCRVQHGTLHSPELQAVIDAGLIYGEVDTLLIPWTTGQPYFQDRYDRNTDDLASIVRHVRAVATLPLRVAGQPIGMLVFALFHQRTWSSVDRVLLETGVQSLELALDRAAKARALDEERAALEAFTRFARAVGSETDVQTLVQQAIALLEETRSVDVAYFEQEGDLFMIRRWNTTFPADLLARSLEGFSLDQPSFGRVNRERQAIFEEPWDAEQQGVPTTAVYRAIAVQPFSQNGEMTSVLSMGSRTLSRWSERDKGIFQAVGQSLNLALDRARQTRMVTAQRDALDVRSRDLATANQELAARTQQLEDSTKELKDSTEELQAFSYSVSHDLRTPVRHMTGFLHLARTSLDGKLDERSARYLDVVEQSGTQMNTLIDGLLDLSRAAQRTLRPRVIDLNQMVKQIQTTLLPDLLNRNVQWEVAALPEVWGDWDALKQVLTQLTENAVKFTRTRDPATIRIWAEDQGETWKVCVGDNGLGFNPRYQDRLFNLFQRLHTVQEASGTGVGLASVRRLILKHSGQVFAEGQVGEGATFGFTLPKGGPFRTQET